MVDITDTIKELLSLTDLVLLDIKHIDPIKCKDLVGYSNEKELAFAKYLSDNGISMWIRQVLVPGYTDNEKDLRPDTFFGKAGEEVLQNQGFNKRLDNMEFIFQDRFDWSQDEVNGFFKKYHKFFWD